MKETHNAAVASSQPQVPVFRFTFNGGPIVRVFVCDFATMPVSISDCVALLNSDEQARANRYRNERAHEQFVRCRGFLRTVLGHELQCDPRDVEFTVNSFGKPELAVRHHAAGLHFNVSHTDGIALLALAPMPVGVDVERQRVIAAAEGMVKRYFHEREQEQFHAMEASVQPEAFLRGWVCKEAVLKGIGCGVRDLDRCIVDLNPRAPAAIIGPDETVANWRLQTWVPASGVLAAVAVNAPTVP